MEKKPKTKKPTILELTKENALLQAKVERLVADDERLRTVFSDLLEDVEYTHEFGYPTSRQRRVIVGSWERVAFLMGELKADADYSCVLQAREDLKKEVSMLHGELARMKMPKDPEGEHNHIPR